MCSDKNLDFAFNLPFFEWIITAKVVKLYVNDIPLWNFSWIRRGSYPIQCAWLTILACTCKHTQKMEAQILIATI